MTTKSLTLDSDGSHELAEGLGLDLGMLNGLFFSTFVILLSLLTSLSLLTILISSISLYHFQKFVFQCFTFCLVFDTGFIVFDSGLTLSFGEIKLYHNFG